MNISVEELLNLSNPKIIDIRMDENYNKGHIPGAINIAYNNLLINPSKYLKKGENYYIYCNHGRTSKGLCSILNSLGYHVYSINGGYESWIARNI